MFGWHGAESVAGLLYGVDGTLKSELAIGTNPSFGALRRVALAAQKLIKDRALGKYHYRAVQLLSQLALKTYSKTQPDRDIETVSITKKIVTIQGWLGDISTRQLRTLFVQIEEIKVIKREPGKITVMLNLDKLKNAEPCADIAKRSAKQHRTDRAAKARVQRAANRKVTRLADAAKAMRDGKERFLTRYCVQKRTANTRVYLSRQKVA